MAISQEMIPVAIVGLLGLVVGSFLNVVIHRVPRGVTTDSPRSRCPACKTEVAARDNVPVLSWLALRGRCRSCGAPISVRYPAVELLTALAFAAVALVRGVDEGLARELPFVAGVIAVGAIDLDHKIIPNRLLLPAAVYGVAAGALVRAGDLPELLIAGAAAFGAMLAIALVQPQGMGMGDVKLAGVMGLYLGVAVVPALLIGFLGGSLVGVGLLLARGAAARKQAIAFGPFLALGALAGVLAGPELIELYTGRFLA